MTLFDGFPSLRDAHHGPEVAEIMSRVSSTASESKLLFASFPLEFVGFGDRLEGFLGAAFVNEIDEASFLMVRNFVMEILTCVVENMLSYAVPCHKVGYSPSAGPIKSE